MRPDVTPKNQCEARVWGHDAWTGSYPCNNLGKYFEDGKWWCGMHAPSKQREREAKRDRIRNSPEILKQKLADAERELRWAQERVDELNRQIADAEATE